MKRFGYDYYENPSKYKDLFYFGNEGMNSRDSDTVFNDGGVIYTIDGINTGFKNVPPVKVWNLYG